VTRLVTVASDPSRSRRRVGDRDVSYSCVEADRDGQAPPAANAVDSSADQMVCRRRPTCRLGCDGDALRRCRRLVGCALFPGSPGLRRISGDGGDRGAASSRHGCGRSGPVLVHPEDGLLGGGDSAPPATGRWCPDRCGDELVQDGSRTAVGVKASSTWLCGECFGGDLQAGHVVAPEVADRSMRQGSGPVEEPMTPLAGSRWWRHSGVYGNRRR